MNEWTATATKNHTNKNKNNKAHLFFTKSYKLIVIAAVATVAIVVVCYFAGGKLRALSCPFFIHSKAFIHKKYA